MSMPTMRLDLALGMMGLVVYLILLSVSPLVVPSGEGAGHLSVDLVGVVAMGLACVGTLLLAQVREAELRANAVVAHHRQTRGLAARGGDMPGDGSVLAFNGLAVFLGVVLGIMLIDPMTVLPENPFAATVAMSIIDGLIGAALLVEFARLGERRREIADEHRFIGAALSIRD